LGGGGVGPTGESVFALKREKRTVEVNHIGGIRGKKRKGSILFHNLKKEEVNLRQHQRSQSRKRWLGALEGERGEDPSGNVKKKDDLRKLTT